MNWLYVFQVCIDYNMSPKNVSIIICLPRMNWLYVSQEWIDYNMSPKNVLIIICLPRMYWLSVLSARYDDDDDVFVIICMYYKTEFDNFMYEWQLCIGYSM